MGIGDGGGHHGLRSGHSRSCLATWSEGYPLPCRLTPLLVHALFVCITGLYPFIRWPIAGIPDIPFCTLFPAAQSWSQYCQASVSISPLCFLSYISQPYINLGISTTKPLARMSVLLDLMIFATGCIHVYFAPYTKVEESFNLHAIHDIIMYGIGNQALEKVSQHSAKSLSRF